MNKKNIIGFTSSPELIPSALSQTIISDNVRSSLKPAITQSGAMAVITKSTPAGPAAPTIIATETTQPAITPAGAIVKIQPAPVATTPAPTIAPTTQPVINAPIQNLQPAYFNMPLPQPQTIVVPGSTAAPGFDFTGITTWLSANPVLALGGGALLLYFLFHKDKSS